MIWFVHWKIHKPSETTQENNWNTSHQIQMFQHLRFRYETMRIVNWKSWKHEIIQTTRKKTKWQPSVNINPVKCMSENKKKTKITCFQMTWLFMENAIWSRIYFYFFPYTSCNSKQERFLLYLENINEVGIVPALNDMTIRWKHI